MTMTAQNQLDRMLGQIAMELDIPDELYESAVGEYEGLGWWLETRDEEVGRRPPAIYAQGSFQINTVVRPITDADEYDIDLVYERDLRKSSTSQDQLKEEAGDHLNEYVDFLLESHKDTPVLESGRRCWTLDYPGQFHMDVLPAIPDDDKREQHGDESETAILISDKRSRAWKNSNPKGYAKWFREQMKDIFLEKRSEIARAGLGANANDLSEAIIKEAADAVPDHKVKTPLQRAIQILKRHRDVCFRDDEENRPASIIITTLAATAYSNERSLVDTLLNLIRKMPGHIEYRQDDGKRVAWVKNPTNDKENFADRWQDEEHPHREQAFRDWLKKVEEDIVASLEGGGMHKLVELLGLSLGRSVVTKAAAAFGNGVRDLRESGGLKMASGSGILGATGDMPVKEHTFYGTEDEHDD